MALPEWGSFQVSATQFPIATNTGNSPLQDADPALFYALDFWAAMISVYVGPRLLAEATALGLTGGPNWQLQSGSQTVVVAQYPYDVGPYLPEAQFTFPLLAAWRTKSSSTKLTAGYFVDNNRFSVAYILPPITAAQAERLVPFLGAIAKTLRNRTDQAWDPNYTPPGGSGPQPGPFSQSFAYIDEIGFDGENAWEHGAMPGAGNLFFPTLLMHGWILERDNPVPDSFSGRQPFSGVDIEVDLADGGAAADGTTLPNLIDASTQQAPTITSLSVTTGSHLGGTSVTLTGTLFLPSPLVLFGNVAATSIVWNSVTSIACVTPALSGPGVLGVTVINQPSTGEDAQQGTLSNAFTFT
jgi:hypothetical protein